MEKETNGKEKKVIQYYDLRSFVLWFTIREIGAYVTVVCHLAFYFQFYLSRSYIAACFVD